MVSIRRTGVAKKICRDDPATFVEGTQIVGNSDDGGGDDRDFKVRKKKTHAKSN